MTVLDPRTPITVLGAGGFIGGRLASYLKGQGVAVETPPRLPADAYIAALRGRPLGHVVYCVGLTSDFRTRPFDTVEAHVGLLGRVLEACDFTSLTYLSSTRVYVRSADTNESAPLSVDPAAAEDLFNLSKLTGEALCRASGRACRIARVSNVFGENDPSENFLTSVLRDAARDGRVTIGLSPSSTKDYLDLDDAVRWLARIAVEGTDGVYNVARGQNTSNAEIAAALTSCGIAMTFKPGGATIAFPRIENDRVVAAFGPARRDVLARIPALLAAARAAR